MLINDTILQDLCAELVAFGIGDSILELDAIWDAVGGVDYVISLANACGTPFSNFSKTPEIFMSDPGCETAPGVPSAGCPNNETLVTRLAL